MGRAFEGDVQGGEDLRHNQRRPGALQGAGGQQGADAVRHAAQQGSDAKESDAPHKQATAAIVIAKLTAHRQADGKGDAVERDDKLQLRGAGRQVWVMASSATLVIEVSISGSIWPPSSSHRPARPGETADVFMGFSIASFSRPT